MFKILLLTVAAALSSAVVLGGKGILEVWEVTYDGLLNPTKLSSNVYDYGDVLPPGGFLLKN